jgi:hypothetical protein
MPFGIEKWLVKYIIFGSYADEENRSRTNRC